jgi:hypothetical protein
MQDALAKAEILEDVERIDALATKPSPEGDAGLFYRANGSDGFEWKFLAPGGKPVRVGAESPE